MAYQIPQPQRWTATIKYRTYMGPIDVDHAFEELEDLHDIIERGPNFYAVEEIVIKPNPEIKVTLDNNLQELEQD